MSLSRHPSSEPIIVQNPLSGYVPSVLSVMPETQSQPIETQSQPIETQSQPNETANQTTSSESQNNDTEYFQNDYVFMLMGHSGEENLNGYNRFELNNNDFYANATLCGRVTYGFTEGLLEKFLFHTSQIRIPKPNNISYYPEHNDPKSIFASVNESSNIYNSNSLLPTRIKYQANPYKIYVPFSKSHMTRSAPNTTYSYFCTRKVITGFKLNNKKSVKNILGFTIDYKEYRLIPVEFSGIVFKMNYSNSGRIEDYIEHNTLIDMKANQAAIETVFGLNPRPITTFYIIVSPELKYRAYNQKMLKYSEYFSIITYEHLIEHINHIRKPGDPIINKLDILDVLYDTKINIPDLFVLLRGMRNDNKPMLIINPLCRGVYIKTKKQLIPHIKRDFSSLFTSTRSLKGTNTNRYKVSKGYLQQQAAQIEQKALNPSWFRRKFTRKRNANSIKRNIMNRQYKTIRNRLYPTNKTQQPNIDNIKTLLNLENENKIANWEKYLSTVPPPKKPWWRF